METAFSHHALLSLRLGCSGCMGRVFSRDAEFSRFQDWPAEKTCELVRIYYAVKQEPLDQRMVILGIAGGGRIKVRSEGSRARERRKTM